MSLHLFFASAFEDKGFSKGKLPNVVLVETECLKNVNVNQT